MSSPPAVQRSPDVPDLPELPAGVTPPAARNPRWPAWMAPLALITGFGATLVLVAVVAIVASAAGSSGVKHLPSGVQLGLTFVQDGVLIAAAIFFAARVRRPKPWHFGLRPTRLGPAVAWATVTLVGVLGFSIFWGALLRAWGIHAQDKLPKELGAGSSTAALVAVAVLVLVVAPIAEEFFFRGFFYASLRNWRGFWPAAVITGLVFAAIHLGSAPAPFLPQLAVLGFGMCALYEKTGSLYPCVMLHALNNSVAFGVGEKYNAAVVVGMILASLLTVGAVMAPLGRRAPRLA